MRKVINVARRNPFMRVMWLVTFTAFIALVTTTSVQAETYYFHNDQLGTPKVVTGSTQEVVWKGEYDPFGNVAEAFALIDQNVRFQGQYFDQESMIHYNYFRSYDPAIGRYLRADPIGILKQFDTPELAEFYEYERVDGESNLGHLYGYVEQNPIFYSDPYGLDKGRVKATLTVAILCACLGQSLPRSSVINPGAPPTPIVVIGPPRIGRSSQCDK